MKPGTDNVIPASKRTHEENVANGRKGGIRSGEAKREKKLFKETIEKKLGKSIEDIVDAMIREASNGNTQASVFLRDTIGEKPTDKLQADVDNHVDIQIKLDDDNE